MRGSLTFKMKRNPDTVRRARENRANMPKAEQALWTILRDRRFIKRKFRRQHDIGIYAVDFACPAVKLVVELDGPLHDDPEQTAFDMRRTDYLQLNGWRVMRIKNDDIFADVGEVQRRIAAEIGD